MKWMDEMVALCQNEENIRCPLCGKEKLDYGFIFLDKKENIGWAAIWCNECHRGKIFSRCKPMENTKIIIDIPHDVVYD